MTRKRTYCQNLTVKFFFIILIFSLHDMHSETKQEMYVMYKIISYFPVKDLKVLCMLFPVMTVQDESNIIHINFVQIQVL